MEIKRSLLSEVNYIDSLRSVIKEAVAETSEFDARGRWDYIKFKIKYFSIRYSSDRRKQRNKEESEVEQSLRKAEYNYNENPNENNYKILEVEKNK